MRTREERRLELVTDFNTLRPGMLVVGKPCVCGGEHELFLLSPVPNAGPRFGRAYTVARRPPCAQPWHTYYVCEADVKARVVYRVVDDLDETKDAQEELADVVESALRMSAAAGLRRVHEYERWDK